MAAIVLGATLGFLVNRLPPTSFNARSVLPLLCANGFDDVNSAAGQLAALSLPTEPSPDLSPEAVVSLLCRGLQYNDVPMIDSGLRRVYEFATFECRAALTSRKGARSGVERFVEFADLWTIPHCKDFRPMGEATLIPGTETRGALATMTVEVDEALGFRFRSGYERTDLAVDADSQQGGDRDGTKTELYLFTLTQERRPPLAGCWLLQAVLPHREHMLFNGDTGVRAREAMRKPWRIMAHTGL